jgi:hypothetical protein
VTPPPLSSSPARPLGSRGSRIVRALRSPYFLYPFFSGVLGYLQGVLGGFFGHGGLFFIVVIVLVVFVAGRAVGNFWRNRKPQGRSGVLMRRASGRSAVPPVGGLMAGAGWRVMRAAAWLMPRAAGSRWLAEAASFLSEAPPAQRRRAFRNYLAAAPQAILVSWAGHLSRRTRAR